MVPRVRLFCFPHAGGGAVAFKDWPRKLAKDIEVCAVELPGRGRRLLEPPLVDLERIMPVLTKAILTRNETPIAFFGHSFGALVAFELARRLRSRKISLVHLFVSGQTAPHLPDPEPPMRQLPDREFIAELRRRYDGIPDEILRDEEMLGLLLPPLRADVTMKETHRYVSGPLLDCPISAFGGREDRGVTKEDLTAWRQQTSGAFKVGMLPGGHFFIDSSRESLVRAVAEDLDHSLRRTHRIGASYD
jgi:medium-chain acyl-[acyl-carrier-protein] hydrolase